MANNGTISGDEVLKGVRERIKEVDADFKELLKTFNTVSAALTKTTSASGIEATIKQVNGLSEKQIALSTKLARLKKEESNAIAAANRAEGASLTNKSKQITLDNKIAAQANKTNSYYKEQSTLFNKLRDTYKSLELKKINGIKLTKQEEIAYKKLSTQVKAMDVAFKKADAAAGQFNRNVGNYPKGISNLVGGLRSLAGAFGFTSGIFLFAAALKDAFTRVREFDKSMQNLAGVLGETRGQIEPIEKEIIAVAGASIKTSREVGELAENLATLGKKGQDLINLIKPANDLSIALQATSADAAEFLVQTLNAFDEPSTSATEFANTITAIRTSTSLDFEKMRDSFQYITPISKILNKDLAYTGAIVGLLADNGLKAESAGRLLGTALQKIAAEGRTLDEVLGEINEAQENGVKGYDLLALASDRFGKQAAKIGIILAGNTDKVEKNAQAIRDNGSAMNNLVNQQLESLDAKIGILDSTWEQFILTIEKGDGELSGFFKRAIQNTTDLIQGWTELAQAQSDIYKTTGKSQDEILTFYDKTKTLINGLTFQITGLKTSYDDLTDKQTEFNNFNERLRVNPNIRILNSEYKSLSAELENNNELTLEQRQIYRKQLKEVESMIVGINAHRDSLQEQALEIVNTTGMFEDYRVQIQSATNEDLEAFIQKNKDVVKSLDEINDAFENLDIKSIDALNAKLSDLNKRRNAIDTTKDRDEFDQLTKEINNTQKELDKLLGKSGVTQKAIIQGSVAAYQDLISKLTELRDGTATTTEEWKKFDDQIAQTERKIKQLTEGADALAKVEGFEPSYSAQDFTQGLGYKDPAEVQRGITNKIAEEKEKERAILKSINDGILADYDGFTKEEVRILEDSLSVQRDLRQDQEEAIKDLVVGGLDTVFQARIDNIDKELDANQNRLDTILNSEKSSTEQKEIAQSKFDKEEAKLLKEKEKREKQAFLVSQGIALAEIAINLARTISAITLMAALLPANALTLGAAGAAYIAANVPIAVGTAALQAGLVIAQTIPAFKYGKGVNDSYEGLALLNDGGKDEVRVNEHGQSEVLKGRNIIAPVAKNDMIIPSVSTFNRQIKDPSSDLYQRVSSKLNADTTQRQNMVVVNTKTDTKGIESAIASAFAKQKRPVYNNKVIIKQPRRTSY
ncbi:phage tail tape measure protein [Cellulophaga phage phi19:1]|uniref:Phage tail tape measure protein n=1 Tax=Cellulophaga phage phi19:1 TaxID=1327970 RepID=R9ZWA8_9CAUD|nr:tail length tape measure protein [Cellulophaga phage phi19:1]AGO47386.1 phage tail tape measure protein [Cellulophaga phage phi19:1]